jgi:Domain of unknown function (DUF6985)
MAVGDASDPVLGRLTQDSRFGWYVSDPHSVRFLSGQHCRFVLDDYDNADEARLSEIQRAVQNALHAGEEVLNDAERYVVQYCNEMLVRYREGQRPDVRIENDGDVWSYVQFGRDIHVTRRAHGDSEDGVYLSLECSCDWEIEHGMQLVLRDGRAVTKVGPYDGHLTNADAYADSSLVGAVYVPMPPQRRR